MQIALSINAKDAGEARSLFARAAQIVPQDGWVHIDVGDGKYTPRTSWGSAIEFSSLLHPQSNILNLRAEVHLMVYDWDRRIVPWLEAGARRIIVPAELVGEPAYFAELVSRYGCEAMPSFAYDADLTDISQRWRGFRAFQVLAVPPGESGQKFRAGALKAIAAMRTAFPNAILEVDGGITNKTAREAKAAGADIVVTSSYVWDDTVPRDAYEELTQI